MGERRVIEQAYRFALAPTPEQERFLSACAGASRFFYNWGLGLVETRLRLRRAYGSSIALPWSYKELCSEFAKVKDEVAPWRSEVVVGSQQAGLEALGAGLQRFLDGRKIGKRVGFPRYRIYNANVQHYNTRTQQFPTLLIAGPLSFRSRDFFEIEVAAERAVPQVAF